jgi:hypothetical protein
MINNPGIQNKGLIVWNGTTAFPKRHVDFVDFGFVFEVMTTLTADARFVVQFHDADEADDCTPESGVDAPANAVCQGPLFAPGPAEFVIPNGTPAGTICSGTVPCRLGKFISLRHVSGGANVRAVLILQGPKRVQ